MRSYITTKSSIFSTWNLNNVTVLYYNYMLTSYYGRDLKPLTYAYIDVHEIGNRNIYIYITNTIGEL